MKVLKVYLKVTYCRLNFKAEHLYNISQALLTLGVVDISSGREVDNIVDELLNRETLDQGSGDEGLACSRGPNQHQR